MATMNPMRPWLITRLMGLPQASHKGSLAKTHYGSFINVETLWSA